MLIRDRNGGLYEVSVWKFTEDNIEHINTEDLVVDSGYKYDWETDEWNTNSDIDDVEDYLKELVLSDGIDFDITKLEG